MYCEFITRSIIYDRSGKARERILLVKMKEVYAEILPVIGPSNCRSCLLFLSKRSLPTVREQLSVHGLLLRGLIGKVAVILLQINELI